MNNCTTPNCGAENIVDYEAASTSPFVSFLAALNKFGPISTLFFTFIMGLIAYILNFIYNKVIRYFFSFIEIKNTDDVYDWVEKYLQEQLLSRTTQELRAQIKKVKYDSWWDQWSSDEKKRPDIEYLPGQGQHFFHYKGKKISLSTSQGKALKTGWDRSITKQLSIKMSCYGSSDILKEIVEKAVDYNQKKADEKIGIYQQDRWGYGWTRVQTKVPRKLESVVLDEDKADKIIKDIKQFQGAADWYFTKGVPYRRGYLFYGPPGTGKTSFTEAIAGAMSLNICYLNLSSGKMDDDMLNRALNQAPSRSIILLEDIDGAFHQRESVLAAKGKGEGGSSITFSGLLNALDGVRSQEGRIVFMSTNHKERLDPALLRPGRADIHEFLNYASVKQMRNIFLRFFPEEEKQAELFTRELPEFKISMAKLQGHFLQHRDSPEDCVKLAKQLLEEEQKEAEMSVGEWLDRLGLSQLTPTFHKKLLRKVSDLAYIRDERSLQELGIMKFIHTSRILSMLKGKTWAKDNFKYFTNHQCRTFIQQYVKDHAQIEQLLSLIPENSITGYQMRDVFDLSHSLTALQQELQKRVIVTMELRKGRLHFQEDEEEKKKKEEAELKKKEQEKKKSENPFPEYPIERLFKEHQMEDKIEKLKEHQLLDPALFWDLEEDQFENLLEIKVYGTRKRLLNRIEEIKQEHKERIEELSKDLPKQEEVTIYRQRTTFQE